MGFFPEELSARSRIIEPKGDIEGAIQGITFFIGEFALVVNETGHGGKSHPCLPYESQADKRGYNIEI
jgi:hypothetical protein